MADRNKGWIRCDGKWQRGEQSSEDVLKQQQQDKKETFLQPGQTYKPNEKNCEDKLDEGPLKSSEEKTENPRPLSGALFKHWESFAKQNEPSSEKIQKPKRPFSEEIKKPKWPINEEIHKPKGPITEEIQKSKRTISEETQKIKWTISEETQKPKRPISEETQKIKWTISEETQKPKRPISEEIQKPKRMISEEIQKPFWLITEKAQKPNQPNIEETQKPNRPVRKDPIRCSVRKNQNRLNHPKPGYEETQKHYSQSSGSTSSGAGSLTEIFQGEPSVIADFLGKLGIEGKLTKAQFLEITSPLLQNEEPNKVSDLLHIFMQRLLTIDYKARHISVKAEPTELSPEFMSDEDVYGFMLKKNKIKTKQSPIHPMDIQIAVFHCADNFLRQILVTKLSQCQYAVPLLVPSPSSRKIEFPLWTVRQIRKCWKTIDSSGEVISKNQFMYKAETPMVAFFRLDSISSSKSQIINSLINERHSTFFHRDSPGSSRDRLLMDGVVEIAWYLPSGKNTDHFTDCVAFCNLHGDSSTNETQRKILTEMASVNVVLLPKLEENDKNKVIVQDLCNSSKSLIVILTDEEDDEDEVSEIGKRKYKVGLKGRNQSNISSTLRSVIRNCLSHQSLTFRLENVAKYTELLLDENDEACQKAKASAQKIMRFLEKEDPSTIKDKYLPCHGKLWIDWCNKDKDLRHLQSNNIEAEKSTKQKEMRGIRIQQQKHGVSNLMNSFIESLNSQSDTEKLYFIKWIANILDDFTSEKLFNIHQEYDKKWERVLTLKNTHGKNTLKKANHFKAEKSNLEKISSKLNAATLGLEHILREMGQIYEASASEKREMQRNQTGNPFFYLPGLAAELMISGHPMELMDGDAAHVPLIWVTAVLDELIKKLGDQRVFVLSVLGIQSSGKSTMLNAMFGLQFAVSAGRCTRGAFMQLVKVSEEMKKELNTDYILVVDTEGLRAMELAGKDTIRHDNELATFVVGLGHMTLINIFGENPAEMQDILQIVVHAFMRMKQVRLNPSCMFVHQNVTDVAAGEKMMEARRRLQEKLDEMTQLAAEDAGFNAECFSDVIAFDVQTDVKYFSQLWEGSPPMAPPNPNYSENIRDLKRVIISRASKITGIKLSQFQTQVTSLWNALLNENFVFSFRNTQDVLLYRKLEEEYEKWTWSLRNAMLSIEDKMMNRISSGKVKTVEKRELLEEIAETLQDVQKRLKVYFEEHHEKETLIQWKCKFEKQIQHLHDDLVDEAKRKLDDNLNQKNIRKNLDDKMNNYEKILFEKSKELALKIKESGNKNRDSKAEFDSLWGKWVSEIAEHSPKNNDINISADVSDILGNIYGHDFVIGQKESNLYKTICTVGDYNVYVSIKSSMTFFLEKSLNSEDQRLIRTLISDVVQQMKEKTKSFPFSVQGYNVAYVHKTVRFVKELVEDFQSKVDSFEFKKEFFVDLSLYVCDRIRVQFVEFHRKYKEANDPLIFFQKKNAEYFRLFQDYFQGATSAVVLGHQICVKVKEAILQSVYNMISTFICGQMRGRPPFNGNRGDLEKHFLKTLAEDGGDEEKFNNFLTYLHKPKTYFENFIKSKVNQFMAAENPQAVSAIKEHIEHKQKSVISAAEMARDKVRCTEGNANMWLEIFFSSLVDELGDTRVHLIDNVSEITDCDVLVNVIKKELHSSSEELKGSFRKLSDLRMEMFRESPDEILIKHFCKCCWEQCPFCGAVCTNSQEDHTGDHNTDYHRSSAIRGVSYKDTTELTLDFCTTAVASDQMFCPRYPDSTTVVPFKQYRTAGGRYAKWRITTDFSDLPYWKWFICEFQENLEKHFKKTFSGKGTIPDEWRQYTQSDAISSLGINQ